MVSAGEALLVGNFYTKPRTRDDEAERAEHDEDDHGDAEDDVYDGDDEDDRESGGSQKIA